MDLGFKNKVVVVTGAASGIGRCTAKMFAAEGAKVALLDYNVEGAEKVRDEILAEGGTDAKAFFLNLSSEENIEECFKQVMDAYGRVDHLANVAGISPFEKIDECDGKSFDKAMDVNIRGTYLICRQAYFVMREQQSGSIVNVSSEAAKLGGRKVSTGYVASKGAIHSLTFHFARNMAPFGRCNCVCPGATETPMLEAQNKLPDMKGTIQDLLNSTVPLGVGRPEDIAHGILFLASDVSARFITGEILDINGGGTTD